MGEPEYNALRILQTPPVKGHLYLVPGRTDIRVDITGYPNWWNRFWQHALLGFTYTKEPLPGPEKPQEGR